MDFTSVETLHKAGARPSRASERASAWAPVGFFFGFRVFAKEEVSKPVGSPSPGLRTEAEFSEKKEGDGSFCLKAGFGWF